MLEIMVFVFFLLFGVVGNYLDFQFGENMVKNFFELDFENLVFLVVLFNMYVVMGRWKDVERIRNMLDVKGVEKYFGYSVEMI